jgi:hypothetical protein
LVSYGEPAEFLLEKLGCVDGFIVRVRVERGKELVLARLWIGKE